MKTALIVISHFSEAWNQLTPEEQAALAARIRRAAENSNVTPVVGYKLSTPGAILEVWEAADREALDRFRDALDDLHFKTFFNAVIMYGQRLESWIQK